MNDQHKTKMENSDEIDLIEFFQLVWSKRIFVIKIAAIFFIFGVFIAFASNKEYKSQATLLPEISAGEGGASGLLRQFGGLSSLAGIDIGGIGNLSGADAISPRLYPEILKSTPFMIQLLNTEVEISSLDTVVTVFTYLTELQKTSILGYLKKVTIGLPGTIISLLRKKEQPKVSPDILKGEILTVTSEQDDAIKILNNRLTAQIDQKTDIISIQAEFPDPYLSASITEYAVNYLVKYITEYRLEKVQNKLSFINDLHTKSKIDFLKAQNVLATYRDENKNIVSAIVLSEEERLQASYTLAFNIYNSLSQQLEQAKIEVQEVTPVLKVLNPVVIPIKKSKPKRMTILFVMGFTGTVIGIGIVFFRNMYNSYLNEKIMQSDQT